jgi:hypothetical protein
MRCHVLSPAVVDALCSGGRRTTCRPCRCGPAPCARIFPAPDGRFRSLPRHSPTQMKSRGTDCPSAKMVGCRRQSCQCAAGLTNAAAMLERWEGIPTDPGSILTHQGSISVDQGSILMHQGSISIGQGSILMHQGSISIGQGSILTHQGSISIGQGSILMHQGSISIDQGSILTHQGSISIDQGSILMHQGSISINQGSILTHQGSISIDQGSILTHQGSISIDQGSILTTVASAKLCWRSPCRPGCISARMLALPSRRRSAYASTPNARISLAAFARARRRRPGSHACGEGAFAAPVARHQARSARTKPASGGTVMVNE